MVGRVRGKPVWLEIGINTALIQGKGHLAHSRRKGEATDEKAVCPAGVEKEQRFTAVPEEC